MSRSEKRSGRLTQHAEQVLGQDQADDVVDRLLVDGEAREAALLGDRDRLVERRLDVERDHLRARGHHLARVLLRELEHSLDEVRVALLEDAALLALLDEHPQLVGGVHLLVGVDRLLPHPAQHDRRRLAEDEVKGKASQANAISGGANQRASDSGWLSAAPLGTSSPKTTWR